MSDVDDEFENIDFDDDGFDDDWDDEVEAVNSASEEEGSLKKSKKKFPLFLLLSGVAFIGVSAYFSLPYVMPQNKVALPVVSLDVAEMPEGTVSEQVEADNISQDSLLNDPTPSIPLEPVQNSDADVLTPMPKDLNAVWGENNLPDLDITDITDVQYEDEEGELEAIVGSLPLTEDDLLPKTEESFFDDSVNVEPPSPHNDLATELLQLREEEVKPAVEPAQESIPDSVIEDIKDIEESAVIEIENSPVSIVVEEDSKPEVVDPIVEEITPVEPVIEKTDEAVKPPSKEEVKPDVKPVIKRVWIIRAAQPGRAVIYDKKSGEMKSVEVGNVVDQVGRITDISKSSGKWVITGTISTIR